MIANLVVYKPWGFEFSVFKKGVSVHILHIDKGEETSFHCHMHKDVLMVLLHGRARMQRSGEIKDFTGISAPYEVPLNPELEIDTEKQTKEDSAKTLYITHLNLPIG